MTRSMSGCLAAMVLLSACDLITGSDEFEVEIQVEGTVLRQVEFRDETPSFVTSAPSEEIECLWEDPRRCRLSETVPFAIHNRGSKTVLFDPFCGGIGLQHRPDDRWENFFEGRGKVCALAAGPRIEILPGERLFLGVGVTSVPEGEYRVDVALQESGHDRLSVGDRTSSPFILRRPYN